MDKTPGVERSGGGRSHTQNQTHSDRCEPCQEERGGSPREADLPSSCGRDPGGSATEKETLGEPQGHYATQNKPDTKRQILAAPLREEPSAAGSQRPEVGRWLPGAGWGGSGELPCSEDRVSAGEGEQVPWAHGGDGPTVV